MAKSAAQYAQSASCPNTGTLCRTAVSVAVAACFSTGIALANPTGGTVVHGTAQITNPAANILNINSLTPQTIINWGGFSIGVGELTRIIQPSALSAVLNRVIGQDPSAILGALQSNGRVFLINPNGITFGAGAQVDVAGLVASTLNLSNEDFLANRLRFTDGAGAGSVVNQGSLTGGSVYLVGKAVANEGLITSPNGEVVLAAGNSVELVNPGTPDLRVEVVAPDNEARNLGTITAEAGRIGIYAGLIKQSGVISADSAVAQGGRIMLKSTRSTTLEAGSVTSARGTSGGEILALSGMTDGVTTVAGTVDASAIASANPGDGGFIETSAAEVQIADSAVITTAGSGDGQTGTWLIDPYDFVIAADGNITAVNLVNALSTTDIVITTAFAGNYYGGMIGNGVNGDILVNQPVSWNSGNSLTLTAERNVAVNQAITNTGTGGINLNAGWDGISSPSSPTLNGAYGGQILLNAPVSTAGNVSLRAYDSIIQGASGPVTAAGLQAVSQTSSVNLANPATSNVVGTVAGSAIGGFVFKNSGNLTIGSVGSSNGVTVDPGSGMHSMINVAVSGGLLTVSQDVTATGGNGYEGVAGGNAVVSLVSNGGITVNNSASVGAEAGSAGSGSFGAGGNGGTASVTLNNTGAGASVAIGSGSSVYAYGGDGGSGDFNFTGGVGGNGTVNLMSSGGLSVAGTLSASGGNGGSGASANGGRGGDGVVNITSTGNTSIASGGYVEAYGGSGGSGTYEGTGTGGRGGDARIMVNAGGGLTVNSASLYASAGWGGSGSTGGGRGGDASIDLASGGNMMISGQLNAYAGAGGWTSSGTGGAGGQGVVTVTSGGTLSVITSSISAIEGGYGGGDAPGAQGASTVTLKSTGALAVSDSTVSAGAGSGEGQFLEVAFLDNSSIGSGGDAKVMLQSTGSTVAVSNSTIEALGGDGYCCVPNTAGGSATVEMMSAGMTTISGSSIRGQGGDGAEGGAGGAGTVTVTAGGGLMVSNTVIDAYGGDAYGSIGTNQGGAATIVLNATGGNIQMASAQGTAVGGYGDIGGSAVNALFSAGNITVTDRIEGSVGAFTTGTAPGSAAVILAAAGDITIGSNAWVWSHGDLGIAGANILLDNALAWGNGSLVVGATGNLDVVSGTELLGGLGGAGNATIGVGGNLTVANDGLIRGNPDVVMSVLGTVNMNDGGIIEAGAPTTIHLAFPMLTSGGYFVNGIEGLVYDPVTHTGFVTNGDPAVLGSTFLVTYGGTTPLTVPTDTLIVAMGDSVTPPEPEKDKDVFEDIKKDKEKEAPVCR